MVPDRIVMLKGGEKLEEVMGRKEEEEMPEFREGAFEVAEQISRNRRIGGVVSRRRLVSDDIGGVVSRLLLPMAVAKGTCIITNMGAIDPSGAQKKVLEVATELGLAISVAVAHEIHVETGSGSSFGTQYCSEGGTSTYLGAAPIVKCLEQYQPDVIITSRVADDALFLAPMIYELGWNWNDLELLAQGTLAGHLLECGCQLSGGYFMHPGAFHTQWLRAE